jgi:murein DD-endopeptidase MepM/ murein hydrolase activator NlpD
VTPERLWDGPFRVPLDGVTTGKNFGRRRILNGEPRSPHTGVDFPAVKGTPVHATQAGRVALAQELYFSGNTVVLDHGLGIYTFYGHLDSIAVQEGETVKAGELLGEVGATGRVTGPHLHWGLTVERARVNPLELVQLLGHEKE